MLTADDLKARHRRLGELSRGLMREVAVIREAEDPLLPRERRAYLAALSNALAGIESARAALAGAALRLDADSRAA